ncbi:DUF2125 domain-containing protein [Frigidibacter albus]|uniref:DUF2125 domain-containing protein n=1 Tax=Frigidibacter albus TaxID=1465486 RepID=A0A6L8VLK9_9RHOB|nr:DUF2125 domain-containing protein [Frigidibacter albus]MZQ90422.1 DUF2125 domain-containing protein [Frigidibacter albus]NBE32458.1 DUF2125 domain-containing protein [Frigidibacter albus]GGH59851.1 hypothetical protein GCM10011341_31550 [Frigidibacter albus]
MEQWKSLGCSTLLAGLLCSTAAQADVTAAEVWQSWQDYYSDMGYTVTAGSEEASGGTLTLRDVTGTSTTPEASGSVTIGEVVMVEQGGAVEITMSPEVPFDMTTVAEDETVEMSMLFTQPDMVMTVSGTPDEMTYDFTAPSLGMSITEMVVNGTPVEMTMEMAASDVTGTSVMGTSGDTTVTQQLSAPEMTFTVSAADPETGGTFTMDGSLTELTGTGTMVMPEGIDMADMAAALTAGMRVDGSFSYGAGSYTMDVVDATDTMNIEAAGEGGSFDVAMNAEALRYGASGTGATMALTGSQIPFPVDISLAESAFSLLMPVSQSEEPAPFAFETRLVDLAVNDEVWAMLDPMAQLPRDPATLILDISGAARMLVDIFDPAQTADPEAVPGELHALDLEELKLTFGGADLTGDGAFTFDNTDMVSYDGFPKPLGSVSLKLLGGNGLLDKLIAMGIVPEEQAMGVRMMAGLFANAGPGPDELNSTIEVREDGGLYANGQRLK